MYHWVEHAGRYVALRSTSAQEGFHGHFNNIGRNSGNNCSEEYFECRRSDFIAEWNVKRAIDFFGSGDYGVYNSLQLPQRIKQLSADLGVDCRRFATLQVC